MARELVQPAAGVAGRDASPTKSVCVAIVTYNSAPHIGECLSSLAAHCPPDLQMTVRVVDNASQDDTAEVVSRYEWVEFDRSPTNDGFAVATNRSIRGSKADYVLALNPDTKLRENVLARLIEILSSDPRIGVVGCRLELADGSLDHACKRSFPSPRGAARYFVDRALRRATTSSYLAQDVDEHSAGQVDAISGAFMLIRSEALGDVGLLDEGYWMYGEDLDWCRRFKLAGWKVWYEGTVTAVHLKGASSGARRNLRVDWHFHRSMWRFYQKFDGGRNRIVDLSICVAIGLRFLLSVLTSVVHRGTLRLSRSPQSATTGTS